MKKSQIILIVVILLVFVGIIWFATQKSKTPSGAEVNPTATPQIGDKTGKEVLSVSAKVLSVDAEKNTLVIKTSYDNKELKVILSKDTKLEKLEYPFNPQQGPPKEGGTFAVRQSEIKISEIKVNDQILVQSKSNIAGKAELNDVDFIQVIKVISNQ